MPRLNSAEIHLHGSTFSVVLNSPLAHLSAFQALLELAVCAFASARDHPTSTARDSDSLQLASNELGAQVSHLHARVGEEVLTAVLYSWLWSCLRAERGYTEVYQSELNAYRTRSREGWPKRTLLELAKTIRARREDVRALKDVATFAVEVLRILRSSNPPPSYIDTVAQYQEAPPTYTTLRCSHLPQDNGAHVPSAPASAVAVAPRRMSGHRRGPFQPSIVQKRASSPALRRSLDAAPTPICPPATSRSSSTSSLASDQDEGSSDRSVRRRRQGPDGASLTATVPAAAAGSQCPPPSTRRSTSLLSGTPPTTTPPASPSSPAWSASSSSAHANTSANPNANGDGEEKTEAQLSFERWLDAPHCPKAVPQWHFQPAEGEADWLTEMLV